MDELRKVVHRSARRREQVIDTDYYTMPPPGMFVGEHTGFVVVDPGLMSALLDVADAARDAVEEIPDVFRSEKDEAVLAALDRLQGVHRG